MALIEFGKDQKNAIKMAVDWINTPSNKRRPIFVVSGYAGTGKSTVISQILLEMKIPKYRVAFCCYTGKAAVALRKLGLNAFTIHKLIYNIQVTPNGVPLFRRKKKISSSIELLVIDELSMVPEQIMTDILSFGVPVLCMGDSGQLPPIYGENSYIQKPDCMLKEVFRQKDTSGIILLATDIRNGEFNPRKDYGEDVEFIPESAFKSKIITQYDQVICATNKIRYLLNSTARKIYGRKSAFPEVGDKLICTANNFKEIVGYYEDIEVFLVNGLIGECTEEASNITDDIVRLRLNIQGMGSCEPLIYCKAKSLLSIYDTIGIKEVAAKDEDVIEFYETYEGRSVHSIEYAYAITCHKSQGSQAVSVLVYDDCFYNRNSDNFFKWMYTAVTRAQRCVHIVTKF